MGSIQIDLRSISKQLGVTKCETKEDFREGIERQLEVE